MASLLNTIRSRFYYPDGRPLSGGRVYTYEAGTLVPKASFSDAQLTIQNTNPVILDSAGGADVFISGSYKVRTFDAKGVLIESIDNISDYPAGVDANNVRIVAPFTGAQQRTQRDKNAESVSVKDFGAIGDGTLHTVAELYTIGAAKYRGFANLAAVQAVYPHVTSVDDSIDWAASQAAVNALFAMGGGSALIPANCHLMTNGQPIMCKTGVNIVGASRYSSIINGYTKTAPCVIFTGQCQISGVKITGGSVGVESSSGDAYHSRIERCNIIGNRFGLKVVEAYITSIFGNIISGNDYGIIARGQNYAVNIIDNIIDNNTSGLGIYQTGSAGMVIHANTIEGNRNIAGTSGCGVLINGTNQRCIITGNWFEENSVHPNQSATDILLGKPSGNTHAQNIINGCVPTEYISEVATSVIGSVYIADNFHFKTKHGIIADSYQEQGRIVIERDVFVGLLDFYNRPILIAGTANRTNITISDLHLVNTANANISTQMSSGIKNTPVFVEGTIPAVGGVTYNGKDLFTVEMTVAEFTALTNATLNCVTRVPTSSYVTRMNDIKEARGALGVTTVAEMDDGVVRSRLIAGASGVLTSGAVNRIIVLSTAGSEVVYQSGASFLGAATHINDVLHSIIITPVLSSSELYLSTGTYYGWCSLTDADYIAKFNGATRLKITDLSPITDKTRDSDLPIGATIKYKRGDIVWNSAPTASNATGWVCVVSGAPATFKAF